MLDKVTDNMKFFMMLLVYVVYLTWWASDISTSLRYQIEVQQKTVILLDAHIEECKEKDLRFVRVEEDIKHLKHDVDILQNRFSLGK